MSKIKVIKKDKKQSVKQCMTLPVKTENETNRQIENTVKNWIAETVKNKALRYAADIALFSV
jgi:hypothetical protein